MARDPDVAKFLRAVKALEKKVAAYVADGGEVLTASKTEIGFFRARDRIEDMLRPLGLTENAECRAALERLKAAVKAAPEAASETRRAGYDREIKRLNELERERHRAMGGYEKELRLMRNGRLPRLR